MKRVILLIVLAILVSCKKEEPKKSNCGKVMAKMQKLDLQGNVIGYQLGIMNEITSNQEAFDVTYTTYLTVQLQDRYCVNGVESW